MKFQRFDFFFQGFSPIVDSTHVKTLTSLQYFLLSTVVWLRIRVFWDVARWCWINVPPPILKEHSAFETS